VDDAAVQQHVEAAEKIVDVLDRGVFAHRDPHEVHELGRAVALEERAARATLIHQLVGVLVGVLDQAVPVRFEGAILGGARSNAHRRTGAVRANRAEAADEREPERRRERIDAEGEAEQVDLEAFDAARQHP